jgi:hypothetical protein
MFKKLQNNENYKEVFSSFPIEYKENYLSYFYRLRSNVIKYRDSRNYLLNKIITPSIDILYILNNMRLKQNDLSICSRFDSIKNKNNTNVINMLIKIHRKAYNKIVIYFKLPFDIEDYIFSFLY